METSRAKMTNVLVTAAGGIVSQGIIKSLKFVNKKKDRSVTYKIIAADASPLAAGIYRSDLGILIPSALSEQYVDSIIKICKEQSIKAIFVGSDEETIPITHARSEIESKTEAIVLTNPAEVITTASDKWKTYEFLKKNNLPYAESALPENQESFIQEFGFPLVVKPRQGHASMHFYVTNNKDEIRYAILAIQKAGWEPILQEYIQGDDVEYTSGVTVNKSGTKIMSSISMLRTMKGGQTYKAFIDDFKLVRKSAEEVAIKIGTRGAINIQARLDTDKPKIFEINPRFSGTCALRAIAGVNEPDIVFRNTVLDQDIQVDGYQRLVAMRFWNEVYLPYSTYEKVSSIGKVETTHQNSFIADYF
jgi:carbamoyl-phosphate synthase large subunit